MYRISIAFHAVLLAAGLFVSHSQAQILRAYVVGFPGEGQQVDVYDAVAGAYLQSYGGDANVSAFAYGITWSGALSPDNHYLWMANFESEESSGGIYVLDTTTGAISHISLGFGTFAPLSSTSVALSPDGTRAYAVVSYSPAGGELIVLDTASQQITNTIQVAGVPASVLVSPDGARIYLSSQAGSVTVFSASTLATVATITIPAANTQLPPSPYLAITQDGRRLLASTQTEVDVIDTQSYSIIGRIPVSGAGPIAITSDGERAFVGWTDVAVIDLTSNSIIESSVGVPAPPNSLALTPDGSAVWAAGTGIGNRYLDRIDSSTYAVQAIPCADGRCTQAYPYTFVTFDHNASLNGSSSTPSGVQNLTLLGTSDWAHWGLYSSTSFDHKATGASQISNYTVVNGDPGSAAAFSGVPAGFSWTDGTPDGAISDTTSGVYISGAGKGFRISLPADTTARTVTLYAGVFATTGKMVAHLSDGSAPDYTDTSFSSGSSAQRAYTFTYEASTPGQTLTLTFTNAGSGGNVNLQSAALANLTQDFTITQSPLTSSISPGNSATYTVTVTPQNGFAGTVVLSASGLPAGATAGFSPATISGSGSSTLTVSTTAATAGGIYDFIVTGAAGGLMHSTSAPLTVVTTDFTISAQPSTESTSGFAGYDISVVALGGFSGAVNLSATGAPSGATVSFAPPSITAPGEAGLTVVLGSGPTPPGTYTLTITGTSGLLVHSVQVSLIVTSTLAGGLPNTPSGTQNLTSLGSLDWAHWGLTSIPSFDHKATGGSQISDYSVVNGQAGLVTNFSGNPFGYTWTDGTPHTSVTNTTTGVYISGANRGFQISVPADTNVRIVTLYAGVYATTGKFVAHLSDGSAPDFIDTSLSSTGSAAGAYQITYQAASAGQNLTLTFTNFGSAGNVNLQAATLSSSAPSPDFAIAAQAVTSSVSPGGTASYSITVTPIAGFNGTVSLAASGLPAGASATFDPPSITHLGTSNLTISTTGSTPGGTYTVTVTGTNGPLVHSTTVTLTINVPGLSSLSGSYYTPMGVQNLTSLGTLDWTHWGLMPVPSLDRKVSGGSQITDYAVINGQPGMDTSFSGNLVGFSWSDGTPHTSVTDTTTGVYINGAGRGFQISVPADTSTRILTVYVGVYATAGHIVAALTDSSACSAPDYTDDSLASGTSAIRAYVFTFQTAQSGCRLTVTFTNNTPTGNVNLQAAALTAP